MTKLIKKLTIIFYLLFSFHCFSQSVSISDLNILYLNQNIPPGGTIEIQENNTQTISFNIQLTNPSGVQGNLRALTIRYSNDNPSTKFEQIVLSGSTNIGIGVSFSLSANNFNETGGSLYAEFESISGLVYHSNSYDIEIIPNPGGGGGTIDPFNLVCNNLLPPITYNQIIPAQYVYPYESINTINGTTPQGGSGTYYYSWRKRSNSTMPWVNINLSNYKDFTPPPGTNNGTQYQRMVLSGDIFSGNPSDCIKHWSNIHTIHLITNTTENIIFANDINIDPGEIFEIHGNAVSSARSISWVKSEDNSYFYGARWLCDQYPYTYCSEAINQTTFYKRSITFHDGSSIGSNTLKINVNLVNNNITFVPELCKLEGSIPQGGYGLGSYTYKWLSKLVSDDVWEEIPGATNIDYFPTTCSPNISTQYRRIVNTRLNGDGLMLRGNNSNIITIFSFSSGIQNTFESNHEPTLSLYPNPTLNKKVEFLYKLNGLTNNNVNNKINVNIFDINGNVVYSKEFNFNYNNIFNERLLLDKLNNGIYFFVLEQNETRLTKQLIIN